MVVAAYDFAGRAAVARPARRVLQQARLLQLAVLFENQVIVNGDHDGDAYLVALDRADGQHPVEVAAREQDPQLFHADHPPDRRPHADDPLRQQVRGQLRPPHGQRHWIIDGPTEQFVASMVYNGRLLFLTAGFPEHHILAIRPDGHGNVTETHVAWRTTKGAAYVPSPIVGRRASIFWWCPTTAWPVASRPTPASGSGAADRAALQRLAGDGRRAGLFPGRRRHDDDRPAGAQVRTSSPRTSWARTATPRRRSAKGKFSCGREQTLVLHRANGGLGTRSRRQQ